MRPPAYLKRIEANMFYLVIAIAVIIIGTVGLGIVSSLEDAYLSTEDAAMVSMLVILAGALWPIAFGVTAICAVVYGLIKLGQLIGAAISKQPGQ